jgi:polyisoprenoid-binding protein YceI
MINEYVADPNHSTAQFNLKNLMIPDVSGEFATLSGNFIYDPQNLDKSLIEAFIDVNSVTTGDEHRDAQLKDKEFFNSEKFPTIKFISKHIEEYDSDVLKVCGYLTIKNITKEVILNVEKPESDFKHMSLAASTLVNREEFGLDVGAILEVGEMLVGDNIQIIMDITLNKK